MEEHAKVTPGQPADKVAPAPPAPAPAAASPPAGAQPLALEFPAWDLVPADTLLVRRRPAR